MRILYVEDNLTNVSLVKRIARNHDVISYIDGEDALKNIKSDSPDVILMDIQLAGRLSGLDVVRELRKQGYTMPIVAVTAYAMLGDRERCLEAGCNDYVAKPLAISPMVEMIRNFEQQHRERNSVKVEETSPLQKSALEMSLHDTQNTKRSADEMSVSESTICPDKMIGSEVEMITQTKPAIDSKPEIIKSEQETNKTKTTTAAIGASPKKPISAEIEEIKPHIDEKVKVRNVKNSVSRR